MLLIQDITLSSIIILYVIRKKLPSSIQESVQKFGEFFFLRIFALNSNFELLKINTIKYN